MTSQRKKETFLGYKKRKFSKSKKSAFPMGLARAFGQKMPFSSLLRFGQNKSKKSLITLKKKKTFLTVTKRIFQSPKSRIFFKGVIFRSLKNCAFPNGLTLTFGQKMPIFFCLCRSREN